MSKTNGAPANDAVEDLVELAIVGEINDQESEVTEKLLGVPPGGECVIYFDSPGGSPYTAISLMTLIVLRDLNATGIVTAECSSAALWPFAACRRRIVTPYSVLLFHPMKWQSEEHIGLSEASEWARHFSHLESDMDRLLARFLKTSLKKLQPWIRPGRYISGKEFAEAGFAELVELAPLAINSAANHPPQNAAAVGARTKRTARRKK